MWLFKKARTISWFAKGVWQKHRNAIIFSLILGIGGFFIANHLAPFLQKQFSPKKIGMVGRFTLADLPNEITSKISLGLTQFDKEGRPAPALADRWEVSNDQKTYTFYLKPNLTWSNGAKFRASDIQFHLSDVKVQVKNQSTINFILEEPFSPFPTLLTKPVFKKGLIGVGPYKVINAKTKGQIVESLAIKNSEETLTYKFYPTEEAARTALKLGEVNSISGTFNCQVEPDWQPFFNLKKSPANTQFVAVFYNTQDPNLGSKSLRQALSYAIDTTLFNQDRALGPVSPDSWAYNPQVKPYAYDPNSAQELFNKFKEERGDEAGEIEITLNTVPTFLPQAETVKKSWEKTLDIKVSVRVINAFSPDFQALLVAQEVSPDPDQYGLWHSTQNSNITRLNSPKIDKLLEDGRRVYDQKERQEIYLDFQRYLLEEAPATFLFHPSDCTISRR